VDVRSVVVAALIAGCGAGEPTGGGPHVEVTTTKPPPPAEPAPVSCPAVAIPEGADVREGLVDLDRDVHPDRMVAWRADDGWHVVVDVKGKGALVADPDPALDDVRPAGAADVGGTRELEVFARVGEADGTPLLGAWTRQGCSLVRLTRDGAPATFPLGATLQLESALGCSSKGVELTSREPVEGGARVRTTVLRLDGTTLQEVATSDDVLDGDRARRRPRCGSVRLPEAP
jgi:hypothetical protein